MKFKKVARDSRNKLLERADILMFQDKQDGSSIGVIRRIFRHGRDRFPDVEVIKVEHDFIGRVTGTSKVTLSVDTYKMGRVVAPSELRDDVDKNSYVKRLREETKESA